MVRIGQQRSPVAVPLEIVASTDHVGLEIVEVVGGITPLRPVGRLTRRAVDAGYSVPVLNRECAGVSVVVVRAMQRDTRAEITHVCKASVGTLDLLVCRKAES